jgi:alpha-L-arabinofuranosidase
LPVELGRRLRDMQKQIDATPGYQGKARIAFTEWLWACCNGSKMSNAPKWDNMAGAITTGGFLNMLLKNADIVPISDMTGIIEFAGIWKKRGQVFATPAYYAFQLYASADLDTPVKASADAGQYDVKGGVTRLPAIPNVPYLDVVAALNKSGDQLTLFCVNRHLEQDVAARVALNGFRASGKADLDSVSSDSIYDVNDEVHPKAVTPVHWTVELKNGALQWTFPRASVTRIELHK